MEDFLDQIEAAASEAGLYYLALSGALVVPDMAAALDATDGKTTGDRYKAWFDTNVAPLYSAYGAMLTGHDCWLFRCSFLHQGRTDDARSGYGRIMFVDPGGAATGLHMTVIEDRVLNNIDVLVIEVRMFCWEMIRAARQWLSGVKGTDPYETNRAAFVTRYPTGYYPYMVGLPVVT